MVFWSPEHRISRDDGRMTTFSSQAPRGSSGLSLIRGTPDPNSLVIGLGVSAASGGCRSIWPIDWLPVPDLCVTAPRPGTLARCLTPEGGEFARTNFETNVFANSRHSSGGAVPGARSSRMLGVVGSVAWDKAQRGAIYQGPKGLSLRGLLLNALYFIKYCYLLTIPLERRASI